MRGHVTLSLNFHQNNGAWFYTCKRIYLISSNLNKCAQIMPVVTLYGQQRQEGAVARTQQQALFCVYCFLASIPRYAHTEERQVHIVAVFNISLFVSPLESLKTNNQICRLKKLRIFFKLILKLT
jgi:hypothetical protein